MKCQQASFPLSKPSVHGKAVTVSQPFWAIAELAAKTITRQNADEMFFLSVCCVPTSFISSSFTSRGWNGCFWRLVQSRCWEHVQPLFSPVYGSMLEQWRLNAPSCLTSIFIPSPAKHNIITIKVIISTMVIFILLSFVRIT